MLHLISKPMGGQANPTAVPAAAVPWQPAACCTQPTMNRQANLPAAPAAAAPWRPAAGGLPSRWQHCCSRGAPQLGLSPGNWPPAAGPGNPPWRPQHAVEPPGHFRCLHDRPEPAYALRPAAGLNFFPSEATAGSKAYSRWLTTCSKDLRAFHCRRKNTMSLLDVWTVYSVSQHKSVGSLPARGWHIEGDALNSALYLQKMRAHEAK